MAISHDVDYSIQIPENESNPSSQNEYSNNLKKFVDFVESKLEEAISLFEVIGDKSNDKSKELQRTKINEFISSLNLLQTCLNTLYSYVIRTHQPFGFQLLRIVSKVFISDSF